MKCKICTHQTYKIFETTILGKYQVSYFNCPTCNFLQTEDEIRNIFYHEEEDREYRCHNSGNK